MVVEVKILLYEMTYKVLAVVLRLIEVVGPCPFRRLC
jgi:hypothetical protein